MAKRAAIAQALIGKPMLVLLDEPTAGLDVATRVELHGMMRELQAGGATIMLATHDMAEAEQMSDRVAILLQGKIVNIGFEQPYIMGNDLVRDFADVISTFVYRMGILSARYNVGAAAGLFQSVVGLVFLLTANTVARKLTDTGIW
jgi:energy-coupling factor transporter ATP-binding protein EcfA2